MAAPTPPNVVCTPYIGRTIKGWTVKVRICVSVTESQYTDAGFANDMFTVYSGPAAAMTPLINALSDATFVPLSSTNALSDLAYGASGETDNAEDSAVFSFATVLGAVGKISIPAPKDAIFLADNMTVNPADTDVSNFVSAVLGGTVGGTGFLNGATKSGAVYALFLGGLRVRRKTRRKYNIWIKDPGLTTPGI